MCTYNDSFWQTGSFFGLWFLFLFEGELLTTEEARNRQWLYDKRTKSGHFSPALLVVKEHLPSGNACMRINIDATRIGNIARFINHSCDGGNLSTLIVRNSGALLPRVCFFSSRVILENEELAFSYGDTTVNSTGSQCFCSSACCSGILPAEHTWCSKVRFCCFKRCGTFILQLVFKKMRSMHATVKFSYREHGFERKML